MVQQQYRQSRSRLMKQDEGRTKMELIAELNKLRAQAEKYADSETQRQAVVDDLKHHTDLETLVMSISTKFINLKFDAIDDAVEQAIGSLGKFFQVSRSYIFLYSADASTMSNTHEWCAPGVSSQKHRLQQLTHDTFPWFDKQMQSFKTVYVTRTNELPEQASALKEELTAEQITSMICVPMVCRNSLLGFVGFDSVRSERAFNDETKASLRMLGEIFANAMNRKQTGQALRDSERIYRTLVENVKFGVALIDKDYNIVMANEAMGRLFGKNAEDIISSKCYSEFARSDGTCDQCLGAKSIQSGLPEVYERTAQRDDGSEFDMYIRAFPLKDEDGNPNGFIEVVEDVTERKKTEKAIQTSEANYRAIFDLASDAIFVHDIDTAEILDVNQKACELFGYTREEMRSLEVSDISVGTAPYSQEDVKKKFAQATEFNASRFEWLSKNKKGQQFWTEVSLRKADIRGTDRILAVVRDMSERKRAELALYMSEQRFRAIADYTYDWEVWGSPGGRPLWTNPAVERVSGYTIDECMAMFNFPEPIVCEDDKAKVVSVFKSAAEGGSGLEFRLKRKDGSIIWATASWQAIYDKKGVSQGFRASIRDISDRKQAQEAIQSLAEGTARATGEDFLRTLVKHLASALGCEYVLIGELSHDIPDHICTLALWAKDRIVDNIEYDLEGTPCVNVVGHNICFYPENLKELFPDDHMIIELAAESYLGIPLFDSSGNGIGLLAAMDVKPMDEMPLAESILTIYATRASAELERKIAEEALKENEERFRTLIANIPGIVYRCQIDEDWTIHYINDMIETVSDYPASDFSDKLRSLNSIIHPDDREMVRDTIMRSVQEHCAFSVEYRIIAADKSIKWVFEKGQAVLIGEHNTQVIDGVIFDINQRKLTEETVKESQRRISTLMSNLPGIAYRCRNDENWTMEFISDGCRELTGYDSDEIQDNCKVSWNDLTHADDRETVKNDIAAAIEQKQPFKLVYRITMACGKEKWVWEQGRGVFSEDGELIALEGLIIDITERKKAGDALRESESRYRLLFEAANDAIFIMRDAKFIDCNERTLELFGCDRQQIIGQPPYRFSPATQPDGRDSTEKAIEKIKLALDGKPQFFEWKHCKYDGTTFDAEVSLNRLVLGEETFLQAMVRDITERKQAEEEVVRLLETLGEKNEELESIVYVSSHDLRSPLVNIQGFSSELDMSCQRITDVLKGLELTAEQTDILQPVLNEQIPESINFIHSSVDKMDMLLNGLLKLCRIGKNELTIQHLDINRMVARTISTMQFQIDKTGTVIDIGQLPDCDGDMMQIDQVFSNLIDNAMKYSSPDRTSEIHITGSIEDEMAVYCVADNGIGISPEYLDIIFEVFHRLEPDGETKGEGLGLTIVKRIVSRHRGTIRVTSKEAKGTEIYISLPVKTTVGG